MPLQQFLLTGNAPRHLHNTFATAAKQLTFTDQLYSWRNGKWMPYPSRGMQALILEETHVQHHHVGGDKLFHLLSSTYYWPSMRADCIKHVAHCFECQLNHGRTHGSWMG